MMDRHHWLVIIIWVLGIILGLSFALTVGMAQHVHPTETITGATGRFYETWLMPDNRAASCCSRKDCYSTQIRMVGGQVEARIRETGKWVRVPDQKIERERDNPDGQNHICATPTGHVYCFIFGGGI